MPAEVDYLIRELLVDRQLAVAGLLKDSLSYFYNLTFVEETQAALTIWYNAKLNMFISVDVGRNERPTPGYKRLRTPQCGDIEINANEELSLFLPARNYYWKYRAAEQGLPMTEIESRLDEYVKQMGKNPNCLTMSEAFNVVLMYMNIMMPMGDSEELNDFTERSKTLRKKPE